MLRYLITILIVSLASSASINKNIADKVALNVNKQFNTSLNKSNYNIDKFEEVKEQDVTVMYAYHLNPIGFILISATDKANPIIGYSFDSNLKLSETPENFTYFINKHKSHLFDIINTNSERTSEVVEEWDFYTNSEYTLREYRDVSPLIDAEFDQSGSWNNTLTSETGFNGPVGCVAVAMAQIMYYWGFPEQGQGSNTYIEDDLGELSVDFSTTYYDFDNMAPTYATNPSRLLLYHSGVAVNMDYDNSGSGAQCEGVYPSAEYAMETFFKYSSIISNADGDVIDNITEFRNLLKNQLDYHKPILFSGFSDIYGNGGHAWNVDGYQNNNLHCNWGWGGWNNGYYNLSTMDGFDTWQNALIDLIPNIYENPLALFEYEINDNNVVFIDLSEVVNGEELSTWEWDFGDGNTASNSFGFTEHTYDESGEYTVSLTITNIYGQTGYEHTETFSISSYVSGDINSDSLINVLDIVMLVNFILDNQSPSSNEYLAADYNSDGSLNVLDIVSLVNEILN
jgi:PKD repeat protein